MLETHDITTFYCYHRDPPQHPSPHDLYQAVNPPSTIISVPVISTAPISAIPSLRL